MLISLIVANPKPRSFCHALAMTAASACRGLGHEVRFHDLYLESFEPVMDEPELRNRRSEDPVVEAHCREAADADVFLIVHPNWWGQPPAILKGWIDRVFRPGVAYEFLDGDNGEGVPRGLLKSRAALVFNTANTPAEREQTVFGDPLEHLWKDCIFGLCGNAVFHRKMFGVIVTSTDAQRAEWLREVRETVLRYFPRERT